MLKEAVAENFPSTAKTVTTTERSDRATVENHMENSALELPAGAPLVPPPSCPKWSAIEADAGNSLLKSRFKPVWAFSFQQCLKICSLWCEKLLTYKKPPGQWSEGKKALAAGFSSFGSNRQYQPAESVQQWRKLWWTDSAKCRLWGISPSQGCKINKKLRIMVYFCFNVNKVS